MENIDHIFAAALRVFADKAKSHRQFALNILAGIITPDFLSKTLKGKKSPSDELKRRIASMLGYSGRKYEDFLDIGRDIVNGEAPSNPVPEPLLPITQPGPEPEAKDETAEANKKTIETQEAFILHLRRQVHDLTEENKLFKRKIKALEDENKLLWGTIDKLKSEQEEGGSGGATETAQPAKRHSGLSGMELNLTKD